MVGTLNQNWLSQRSADAALPRERGRDFGRRSCAYRDRGRRRRAAEAIVNLDQREGNNVQHWRMFKISAVVNGGRCHGGHVDICFGRSGNGF